jgi:hypothetical protein
MLPLPDAYVGFDITPIHSVCVEVPAYVTAKVELSTSGQPHLDHDIVRRFVLVVSRFDLDHTTVIVRHPDVDNVQRWREVFRKVALGSFCYC